MNMLFSRISESIKARTDLTKLFRRNACIVHGIPWNESENTLPETPVNINITNSIPPQTQSTSTTLPEKSDTNNKGSFLKRWGPTVALLLGGSGVGAGITGISSYFLNSDEENPPAVLQSQDNQDNQDSLLQYLEDQGEHLP